MCERGRLRWDGRIEAVRLASLWRSTIRLRDLRAGLTTSVEARQFVEETKIDILAPAIGNMHGMLMTMVTGDTKKRLDTLIEADA
jgi:fructose/tagatose bisphosphate aldolase